MYECFRHENLSFIHVGFPLSQLIFYVCGGIAVFLLLAFFAVLLTALGFKVRKKLSQRNYNTLH